MKDKQRALLIELRSKVIGKENTMPYCVYTDATIEDLLDAQPKTIEELVKVKGFPEGGKRVKGFGEAIIAIFTNTDKVASFDLTESNGNFYIGTNLRKIEAF